MIHFIGFVLGMIGIYLYDLAISIIGRPLRPTDWGLATDCGDAEENLPTQATDDCTIATYQNEPIVTKTESGSTVNWTWTTKSK